MANPKKEYIKNIEVHKIKPYSKNPRINDGAVDAVVNSIKKNGYISIIVTDENYTILCGHTRILALKKLNIKECDIMKISGLTDKQKKDFRVRDNKSGELALWDYKALEADFKLPELKDLGFDLQADFDIEPEPDKKADIIPEVDSKNTICKTGDLWQLGKHRLLCGDSTKEENVKRLMGGKKADMVFTDPPYGINIVKNNTLGVGGKLGFVGATGVVKARKYKRIENDENTNVAKNNYLLLKKNGFKNFIIWGGNYFTDFLPITRNWIIWDKKPPDMENTFADCEIAYCSIDKNAKIYRHLWAGLLRKGNRKEELMERVHPTQKPVGLFEDILNDYKDYKLILDCFLGSGSTLIACEKTDRICNGMEICPNYCDVIIKRYEDYTGDKARLIK